MINEPYKPITDPTERLIQIRGVKKKNGAMPYLDAQSTERIQMTVPLAVQEFFAKLLNHIGHRSDWFATCVTCRRWGFANAGLSGAKHCHKFNCLPPPEVIADGCEYYEDEDVIPF